MRAALWIAAVAAPLALLAILLARPEIDEKWENNPAHVWLVLAAAATVAGLFAALSAAELSPERAYAVVQRADLRPVPSGTRSVSVPSISTRHSPAREKLSVVLGDLAGFTSFSERHHPADVATMLNAYFERIVPLMERVGGEVHQIVGDELMVVFGTRTASGDHAARAARAGLLL